MDKETLRRAQHVLQTMIGDPRLRVSFLLDQHGRLAAHAGAAPSFHPNGQFPDDAGDEHTSGENVYMTGIEECFVLGAIFDEDLSVESLRDVITPYRDQLAGVLSAYIRAARR